MSEKAQQIFNNIVQNNERESIAAFGTGIREKLDDALEIRKVNLTTDIFNKSNEDTNDDN